MLSRTDRYIIREVLLTFTATGLVLLAIVLSSRLAGFFSRAASGAISQDVIWLLLGLQAIRFLIILIPVAFLLGAMLALGRLYRDNEMTAMTACGFGPEAVFRPLLTLALPLALLLGFLSLYVVPKAMELRYGLLEQARQEAEVSVFKPGTFREIAGGRYVIYVEELVDNGATLRKVFVKSSLPEGVAVTTGASGRQEIDPDTGDRFIVLERGHRYEGAPGQKDYQNVRFEQLMVRLETAPADQGRERLESLPSERLWNTSEPAGKAELHARLGGSISVVLLALLAPLLARAKPREGRYGRLVAAILVYAIYLNLLGVGQAWIEHEVLWPALGLWWVHGLLAVLILILWYAYYGRGERAYRRFRIRARHP